MKNICLFLTYGMSLKKWDQLGLFERETLPYRELAKRGFNVGVFTYGTEEDLLFNDRIPGIEIIPAYKSGHLIKTGFFRFFSSLFLPIRHHRRLKKYTLLKTNQMYGFWVPLLTKWLTGAKLIIRCGYEYHQTTVRDKKGSFKKTVVYCLSKVAYSFADHIIVTTARIRDYICKTFGILENHITICPNFIDTVLFSKKAVPPVQGRRVLYVGRLSEEKNIPCLIEACRQAKAGLDIVGQGPLKSELELLSRSKNADVRFLGVVANHRLPEIISSYPVFVLPSRYEGNPKTLLEAMSCESAVIGSNVEGIRDVISDRESGILSESDAKSMTHHIAYVLDHTKESALLGKNARNYILDHCNIEKVLQKELAVYKKVLCQSF